jgi:phosphoribosylanthranilate isomerase
VNTCSESGSVPPSSKSRVRIKICGLTRDEDVRLAVALGADYLGFVFAPSSRRVTPETVGSIVHALEKERPAEPSGPERVGVFVDEDGDVIEEAARQAGLTMLQLHGDENPELCARFDLPVIKALRIRDRGIFDRIRSYPTPYILLEPYVPGKRGGTGVQANWRMAGEIVRYFPDKRFFLAGGLGEGNVAAAVTAVRPFAVDASSALESAPGVKDRQKMEDFIKAVRNG